MAYKELSILGIISVYSFSEVPFNFTQLRRLEKYVLFKKLYHNVSRNKELIMECNVCSSKRNIQFTESFIILSKYSR